MPNLKGKGGGSWQVRLAENPVLRQLADLMVFRIGSRLTFKMNFELSATVSVGRHAVREGDQSTYRKRITVMSGSKAKTLVEISSKSCSYSGPR